MHSYDIKIVCGQSQRSTNLNERCHSNIPHITTMEDIIHQSFVICDTVNFVGLLDSILGLRWFQSVFYSRVLSNIIRSPVALHDIGVSM